MNSDLLNRTEFETGGIDDGKKYRFRVAIVPEEDGSFSAISVNLPGVASCGETREEAIENFQEAAHLAICSYLDAGVQIPWDNNRRFEQQMERERWVTVNA